MSKIKTYKNAIKAEAREWKEETNLFTKHTQYYLFAAIAILLFTFFSLLRANFNYIDDLGHVVSGHPEWAYNFGRYIMYLENVLVQMNFLIDISPFNQVLSLVILAVSVIIVAYTISKIAGEDKLSIRFFIPSLIIAFNPHFLECLAYKYESIGMASAVFFAVLPFLFMEKHKLFYFVSFISTVLMCMSYQAASGVYIVFVLLLGVIKFAKDEFDLKNLFKFYVFSAIAYLAALIFYYGLFTPFMHPYRSIEVAASQGLISRVFLNATSYLKSIWADYSITWRILSLLTIVISVASFAKFSRNEKRAISTILYVIVLVIASILSAGAYLALDSFGTGARMIFGFGIFLSLTANIAVINNVDKKKTKVLFAFVPFVLTWLFFVYAMGFGNLLASQDEYEKSFEMRILSDLNELLEPSEEEYNIMQLGSVGLSAQARHANRLYPITSNLIPVTLNNRWHWSGYRLRSYYGKGFYYKGETYEFDINDFELIAERLYYDIYRTGQDILIRFNEEMLF